MEKPQLFISEDLPAEEKLILVCSQKILDLMVFYKEKQEAGTLTLKDLEDLSEQGNAIVDEFPVSNEPVEGFPPQTSDMDELEAIANARAAEDLKLLEENGGPVYKIESFEQLKKLAAMGPEAAGALMLKAAEEKREAKTEPEAPQPFVPPLQKRKMEFKSDMICETLDEITRYLYCAKLIYFDLYSDWTDIEIYEEGLISKLNVFKGFGKEGKDRLLGILYQDEKDEDLLAKTTEAALILASLDGECCADWQDLIAVWTKNKEIGPHIISALKYTANPALNGKITEQLDRVTPAIRIGLIDVLEHREAIAEARWNEVLQQNAIPVKEKILRAFVINNLATNRSQLDNLLEDPESEVYEESLFVNLLSGNKTALHSSRVFLNQHPDQVKQLPLYLACAGDTRDFRLLKTCLQSETAKFSAFQALGIMGLPEAVPLLMQLFPTMLTKKAEWDLCVALMRSLELITGADLPLSIPEIKEGPQGKEYEITVSVDFKNQWLVWWYQHEDRFRSGQRYRRGLPFTLASCVDEMAFAKGSYWSRQYSFYELQIRSGKHIAPFFADWNVKRQLESIQIWRHWWLEHKHEYPADPWLFNGSSI